MGVTDNLKTWTFLAVYVLISWLRQKSLLLLLCTFCSVHGYPVSRDNKGLSSRPIKACGRCIYAVSVACDVDIAV